MNRLKRELALVKVVATGTQQDGALDLVGKWSGRLLELSKDTFVVEVAGSPQHLTEFLEQIGGFGEVCSKRSGALSFSEI